MTNSLVISNKKTGLGCKGSLVRIQSRRPISPYKINDIGTPAKTRRGALSINSIQSVSICINECRVIGGKVSLSKLLSSSSDQSFKTLTTFSIHSKSSLFRRMSLRPDHSSRTVAVRNRLEWALLTPTSLQNGRWPTCPCEELGHLRKDKAEPRNGLRSLPTPNSRVQFKHKLKVSRVKSIGGKSGTASR